MGRIPNKYHTKSSKYFKGDIPFPEDEGVFKSPQGKWVARIGKWNERTKSYVLVSAYQHSHKGTVTKKFNQLIKERDE